jgi:hypothetical protein
MRQRDFMLGIDSMKVWASVAVFASLEYTIRWKTRDWDSRFISTTPPSLAQPEKKTQAARTIEVGPARVKIA